MTAVTAVTRRTQSEIRPPVGDEGCAVVAFSLSERALQESSKSLQPCRAETVEWEARDSLRNSEQTQRDTETLHWHTTNAWCEEVHLSAVSPTRQPGVEPATRVQQGYVTFSQSPSQSQRARSAPKQKTAALRGSC